MLLANHGAFRAGRTQGSALDTTPIDVASNAIWLDASRGIFVERTGVSATTSPSNGGVVGTWLDQSGNSRHFTAEADGERATWHSSVINGRPVVSFNGTNVLTNINSPFLNNRPGATIICVARTTTLSTVTSSSTRFFQAQNNANLTRFDLGEWELNNAIAASYRRLDGDSSTFANPLNTRTINWEILSTTIDWFNGGGGAFRTAKNGTTISSATVSGTGNCSATNSTRLCVGGIRNGSGIIVSLRGDIAELVVYPQNVEADGVRRVEEYLANKYGIALSELEFVL